MDDETKFGEEGWWSGLSALKEKVNHQVSVDIQAMERLRGDTTERLREKIILSSLQGSADKILAHALEHNVDIKDAAVAYIRVAMTLADGVIEMMEK